MTRDDIIRMSQASGVLMTTPSGVQIWCPDELERFAALVAAHEREACAKFVENCNGELGCQGYLIRARGVKP